VSTQKKSNYGLAILLPDSNIGTNIRAVPFVNAQVLADHFQKHGSAFHGISSASEYLVKAELFLFGQISDTAVECFRPNGGMARYDPATEEYGAVRPDGFIGTYFIPDPAIHGFASNREYFDWRCR